MKRKLAALVLLAALAPATGCYQDMIIVDSKYNPGKSLPDYTTTQFNLIGLVNLSGPVNITSVCQGGPGIVEVKTLFSIGVITFSQVGVYCK